MKEGKIFDDVTSGVSQLASKVGGAPPDVRAQLAVSTFPCVGTESVLGPPLPSDVQGQADSLVSTAGECGGGRMAGSAPNLSLLFLVLLLPLTTPGECRPLTCGGRLPAVAASPWAGRV